MKHLRMSAAVVGVAMALTAVVGVASASAVGIMPSSTEFTGTGTLIKSEKIGGVTHNWTWTFTTNGGLGPYFKCEQNEISGITAATTTLEVTFKTTRKKCFSNIGGSLVAAEVIAPKESHLTIKKFFGITYSHTLKLTGETLKIPAVGCEITIPEQEISGEGKNDSGTPPAGTEIETGTESITYTGNAACASNGVSNGTANAVGPIHIPVVYVE